MEKIFQKIKITSQNVTRGSIMSHNDIERYYVAQNTTKGTQNVAYRAQNTFLFFYLLRISLFTRQTYSVENGLSIRARRIQEIHRILTGDMECRKGSSRMCDQVTQNVTSGTWNDIKGTQNAIWVTYNNTKTDIGVPRVTQNVTKKTQNAIQKIQKSLG